MLGEDDSDIQTLRVLIRRLANDETLPIRGKGFDGCGKLLKDGWKFLKTLPELGCTRFIIAHDADQRDTNKVKRELIDKIIKPSGVKTSICLLLVPVQEIEAWLLADIEAVSNIFKQWQPKPELNPESIVHAKEHLEKLGRLAVSVHSPLGARASRPLKWRPRWPRSQEKAGGSERLRLAGGRPRYLPATHNPQLAKHIDLTKVSKRCPSFRPLEEFVKQGKSNY